MTRLPTLAEADLSPDQKFAIDEAVAGPRAKVPAPMQAWLRNPALARRAQGLGALLRFETSLGRDLTELAILVCARHWRSHYEWTAHSALALSAGLDRDLVESIAEDRVPVFTSSELELVYRVSSELIATSRLSDALYSEARLALGETALVELVAVLGYYSLVALTLNAFEIGLPEANVSQFQPPHNGSIDD